MCVHETLSRCQLIEIVTFLMTFQNLHFVHLQLILFHMFIGKHSLNLPIHKNGAPPDLTGDYKQKHVLKNNCSSSTTKRAQQTSSNMNSNCCFNVPARVVLYFLSWSGFLVSFMMRNDVSSSLNF